MTDHLFIPELSPADDVLTAALKYASAGWYVGPVRGKKPALKKGWPSLTSRDPEVIVTWYAGTSARGVFLHCGRSGAISFDVDHPEKLPPALIRAIEEFKPPYQSSRPDEPGRGHYVFAMPPGRMLGSGLGTLGGGWGEIRGCNGLIVAAPSPHRDGGLYRWPLAGPVPGLPAYVGNGLPDATNAADAATDAQVVAFLAEHTASARPDLLGIHVGGYQHKVANGESRHAEMCGPLAGAMKEASIGLLDAKLAADTLETEFLAAVAQSPQGKQGSARTGAKARNEWRGLLAWAVAQALASDPAEVLARVNERVGPHPTAWIDDQAVAGTPTPVATGNEFTVDSCTLDETHATFTRWLGVEYDLEALDVVLCAAAAERLDGDPLWLLLISGSGNAKTETVQALTGAGAMLTSTISSEGALLSATPKREKTEAATGGLLRAIGERGVLVVKDFSSILSMNRDMRAAVLAALREVYDGQWSRNVGTDGGRTLTWKGRIVVVGAVTTAWDRAHDVTAAMGDRFVLVRVDSTEGRSAAGRHTIRNTGDEVTMRAELAAAAGGVIAGVDTSADLSLTEAEGERLLAVADVVTLARTGVEYDYRGDVIDAHAPEMPTRFTRQLQQIVRGGIALGMDRDRAMRLAIRCARDSMPPLRLAILLDVAAHPDASTPEVRKRIDKPRTTVDRQLQALHMLGLLTCSETAILRGAVTGTVLRYAVRDGIDTAGLCPPSQNC